MATALLALWLPPPPAHSEQLTRPDGESRTLVLALDGMPFRLVERARRAGAFVGWPPTSRLISTFPSITNVCFTRMFEPFGVEPAPGYEVRYFDHEENGFIGGTPVGYEARSFSWRGYFDIVGSGIGSKLALYTKPEKKLQKELEHIRQGVLESELPIIFAHIGSTDVIQHIKGDQPNYEFLLQLDEWLKRLKQEHLDRRGTPLSVTMLSDHGNSLRKIHMVNGIQNRLRKKGLNASNRLEEPGDVVASSFGVLGWGSVFTFPEDAERVARILNGHNALEFIAWRSGPREIHVLDRKRSAYIRWKQESGRLRVAYQTKRGDPLRLNRARAEMRDIDLLDGDGFADDRDWLVYTSTSHYPDVMRRLIDVFTGTHVANQATVFFTLRAGWGWGWKSAHIGSWLTGGLMEGTHGAMDADSSLGFYLSERLELYPGPAIRAGDALLPFVDAWRQAHGTVEEREYVGPPTDSQGRAVELVQD
jgi:hypothetical protein